MSTWRLHEDRIQDRSSRSVERDYSQSPPAAI